MQQAIIRKPGHKKGQSLTGEEEQKKNIVDVLSIYE
jgi:hypothetical protein